MNEPVQECRLEAETIFAGGGKRKRKGQRKKENLCPI